MAAKSAKYAIIQVETLDAVIAALKKLDVCGFDSMDGLVGSVIILERARNEAITIPVEEEKPENAEPDTVKEG